MPIDESLRCRTRVFDRWWTHRLGTVIKRSKSSIHVKWSDEEVWRYDTPHSKFLTKYNKS